MLEGIHRILSPNDLLAYIAMMTARLVELHRVLRPTGSLYLHCDSTATHYLKVMLDAIFRPEQFRNEVIWKRTTAHNTAKRYGPVHDVLLYYGKSSEVVWNPQLQPYSDDYLESKYRYEDERGRYRLTDITGSGTRNGASGSPWRDRDPTLKGRHWMVPPDDLDKLDADGLVYWGKNGESWPQLKRYLEAQSGVPLQDVWTDIDPINSRAAERLGYPTQKPLTLLERIIESSSDVGDVVLDPFCGCGTTIDAAQQLRRRWIGIDITKVALDIIVKRLRKEYRQPRLRAGWRAIDSGGGRRPG